ncbi:MAG TPA: serine hydrolase domain-containing protein [Terriglobales bacterium]|nr:serine hydrolase domain-containing protein [Terriglobales bacterium]
MLITYTTAFRTAPGREKIDAIFMPLVSENSPGLAVGVINNGRLMVAAGYGSADLKSRTPITATTDFRLASLTKQFTAMAIMLLVHERKLRYEDRLTKIFPEFPTYGSTITIRHLLNHTSGLKHYEDIYDRQMSGTVRDKIPQLHDADVLRLLEQQNSGEFVPGTRWEYSNSGYAALAMIVERVAGERFEDFLNARIFRPLCMWHTVAYVQGRNRVLNRAFGYRRPNGDQAWQWSDQSPTSAVLGDGGIYSSIEDLAKWDLGLKNHTLLDADEMQPAFTPVEVQGVKLPDGASSAYGFGWFLDPYKGHNRTWHYGDTSGFHTAIERFADENLTVIVLANRTDLDAPALALRVADLYLK